MVGWTVSHGDESGKSDPVYQHRYHTVLNKMTCTVNDINVVVIVF